MYETKRISIGSFSMAYADSGGLKPIIVFVHGLPTSKELFYPLMKHLEPEYRVIAPDLIDYGESDRVGRHISHEERGVQLKQFLDQLHLKDVVLAAHDLGASVTMDFLGSSTETVRKLVIMSPPVYPDFPVPAVVRIVRSGGIGPILILTLRNLLLRTSIRRGLVNKAAYGTYLQEHLEAAFSGKEGRRALLRNLRWGSPAPVFNDYPATICRIEQQTLVIHGAKDPYIPRDHSERLAKDIPSSIFHLIEEGSHFLPIDQPLILSEVIDTFIKST